jgi:hypothetical protein
LRQVPRREGDLLDDREVLVRLDDLAQKPPANVVMVIDQQDLDWVRI